MIAISAVRAICSPKVGPIELDEKSVARDAEAPRRARRSTSLTLSGSSCGVAIWMTFVPSSGSSTSWILASP